MEPKNESRDAAAMKTEWQQRHEASQNGGRESQRERQNEWHDHTDTEKYLGLEQDGVSFTPESHAELNSDYIETRDQESDHWKANGDNSRNADAFNQDDYILRDNIDLDEDQNESLSNEDADR
jgi:hypothetical protein